MKRHAIGPNLIVVPMRAHLLMLLISMVGLWPSSAEAEERRYPTANMLELGLYSGAFIPSKSHELYDSTQSFQSPLDPFGLSLSLRGSYFLLSWLGAELEGGFMPMKNARNESVRLFTARGHAVVQLPWVVTPFVLAGGGYLGSSSDSGNDLDRALHWGGGLKVYPVSWMSFRVDARQIWTASKGPSAGNTSHFELLAGLSFTLWRGEEEPEVPAVIFVAETKKAPDVLEPVSEPVVMEANRVFQQPTPAERVVDHLEQVHFSFGSAKLGPNAFPALDRAVSELDAHDELYVRIAGHTDAIGTSAFNMKLSRRRAESVVEYLVGAGIAAFRLRSAYFGESSPTASNDTPEGRARNRRCEIRVYDEAGAPLASTQPSQ